MPKTLREVMRDAIAEFLRNHKDGLGVPRYHGDTEEARETAEIILNLLYVPSDPDEHERKIAEKAWNKGHSAGWDDCAYVTDTGHDRDTPNPYAKEASHG